MSCISYTTNRLVVQEPELCYLEEAWIPEQREAVVLVVLVVPVESGEVSKQGDLIERRMIVVEYYKEYSCVHEVDFLWNILDKSKC